MAECIEILREAVNRYKSGELDAQRFRDKVFDTITASMDQSFDPAETRIVLRLMEQMKSLGVADPATCDEVAEHFRSMGQGAGDAEDDVPTRRVDRQSESAPQAPPPGPSAAMPYGAGPYPGMVAQPPSYQHEGHRQAMRLKNLAEWYMWLLIAYVALSFAGVVPLLGIFASLLTIPVVWSLMIIGLLLIYSYWHYLSGEPGAMRPVVSTILLLLPLVNLLLLFPAIHGVSRTLKRHMLAENIGAKPPSTALTMWACSLITFPILLLVLGGLLVLLDNWSGPSNNMSWLAIVMALLAFACMLCILAGGILTIFMFKDLSMAMGAVLYARQNPEPPRYAPFVWTVCIYFGVNLVILGAVFYFVINAFSMY